MLLVMRLKRHTVLVILEFRVNQGSLESELVKLLHFLEELDSLFLYITWKPTVPTKTNLPQLL